MEEIRAVSGIGHCLFKSVFSRTAKAHKFCLKK